VQWFVHAITAICLLVGASARAEVRGADPYKPPQLKEAAQWPAVAFEIPRSTASSRDVRLPVCTPPASSMPAEPLRRAVESCALVRAGITPVDELRVSARGPPRS
jgi:hypothetical protein